MSVQVSFEVSTSTSIYKQRTTSETTSTTQAIARNGTRIGSRGIGCNMVTQASVLVGPNLQAKPFSGSAQCANPQTAFVHEGQPPPDWRRIPRESTCLTESGSPRDGVGAPQAGGCTLKVQCVARRSVSYKRRPKLKGLNTSDEFGVPSQVAEPLLSCNQIVSQMFLWI